MRTEVSARGWRLLGASLALVSGLCAQGEAEKLLQKKEPSERLKGVELLIERGGPTAEDLLQKSLKDKDWEVQWAAVRGLHAHGSTKSTKLLVDLAIDGVIAAVREASAQACAKLDPTAAGPLIVARMKGDELVRALEALAFVPAPNPAAIKAIVKHTTSLEPPVQLAALRALGALADPAHLALFKGHLGSEDTPLAVVAAAALAKLATPEAFEALVARLEAPPMHEVLERKIRLAIIDSWRKQADSALPLARVQRLIQADAATTAGRGVRLAVSLFEAEPKLGGRDDLLRSVRDKSLAHADAGVRAAAAHALAAVRDAEAPALFRTRLAGETNERVVIQLLRGLVRIDGAAATEALRAALSHAQAPVREEAAVLLVTSVGRAASAELSKGLADADWRVGLAAAISLGKLQGEGASAELVKLAGHSEWQRRAAGVAGLGFGGWKEGIPILLERLNDADPVVKSSALNALRRISGEKHKADPKVWAKWWQQRADSFQFVDRFARPKPAGDYDRDGFRRNPYAVFKDIDVIVLTQERDQLQQLLEDLEITHSLTRAGQVAASGLHPDVVFMVNCPGQIQGEDGDRLAWLVRAGGHLISSCWGLTNTVAKTFPGYISAHPQGKSPAGAVEAWPAAPDSAHLKDVFDATTRPLYQLAGYQLIIVHDPERVEVLIDSAEAAKSFGQGNLAAHFSVGHGVVLQSTNHFALQGLRRERFKTEEERATYAFERLGIPFEKLRELRGKGLLADQTKAAAACEDLTILRLIARLVQVKRLASQ